ncbi:hypothetical protein D3C73_1223440 [compost metagenome]
MPLALAASYNVRFRALPPMTIFQPPKSTVCAALALRTICKMVGTQWENVTFSLRHNSTRYSGS